MPRNVKNIYAFKIEIKSLTGKGGLRNKVVYLRVLTPNASTRRLSHQNKNYKIKMLLYEEY